jgi:hypothetical protein
LVKNFDSSFQEIINTNKSKIWLYIQMELCDKKLENVINEFHKDSNLKNNRTLTTVGYYIATKIFVQILKGVNHLHK